MSRITSVDDAVALLHRYGLDLAGVEPIVVIALSEDLGGHGVLPPGTGHGVDVTSVATIPADAEALAEIVTRAPGRLAGGAVAAYVLALVCAEAGPIEIEVLIDDGTDVARGDVVLRVRANTRALLRAERVALNLLTMISGVATATAAWVAALEGSADSGAGLAQDSSRAADAAEVRGPRRWWGQSPDVPGRRRSDQGQSRCCRRRGRRGIPSRHATIPRYCRSSRGRLDRPSP